MNTRLGERYGTVWTGEVMLELRNGRDWSVGDAQLCLRDDSVLVRYQERQLAVLDRDRFRDWLIEAEPEPLLVDEVVWSVQIGSTFLEAGTATFRIGAKSLAHLVAVI